MTEFSKRYLWWCWWKYRLARLLHRLGFNKSVPLGIGWCSTFEGGIVSDTWARRVRWNDQP